MGYIAPLVLIVLVVGILFYSFNVLREYQRAVVF